MTSRMIQKLAGLRSLRTGFLAALAMLGLAATSQACNRPGGGTGAGGGPMSGNPMAGAGGGAGMAQAMMGGAISHAQMQAVQMQYMANLQAQQNLMMQQQQMQQQQYQQMLAIRQAKKKAAADKTVNVSYKAKLSRPAKPVKSSTTSGPSV